MTDPEFPIVATAVPVCSNVVGPAAPVLYGIIFKEKESGYWRKRMGLSSEKGQKLANVCCPAVYTVLHSIACKLWDPQLHAA